MSGATRRVTLRGMARPFLRVALFLVERAALFIRQRTSPLKATKNPRQITASLAVLT